MKNLSGRKKGLVLLISLFLTVFLCRAEQKNIFFLYTFPDDMPWVKSLNQGVFDAMENHPEWVLYSECLDRRRLKDSMSDREWVNYLSLKYAEVDFDFVLSESALAGRFINSYGRELFGEVPKFLFTFEDLPPLPETYYFKTQQNQAVLETIRLAVKQNPHRKRVVIIHYGANLYLENKEAIEDFLDNEGMEKEEITDFELEDMLRRVKNLEGDEILFFFLVTTDNSGATFVPANVLYRISEVSPSPVYTFWSSLLGYGTVGGVMVDSRKIGLEMFRAIEDYIDTGTFSSDYTTNQTFLDWELIHSFDPDLRNLPEDLIFLNEPVPFLKTNYRWILYAMFIVCLFFIAVLYSRQKISRVHEKLKLAYHDLEQFAYVASHDLKAPLRGIDNTSSWLEEDLKDIIPEESLQHLRLLRNRVQRMEGLLSGLLEYSRIGRENSPPETIDIKLMIEDMVAFLAVPDGFQIRIEAEKLFFKVQRVPLEMIFWIWN